MPYLYLISIMKLMRPGKILVMSTAYDGNIINLNFTNMMYVLTRVKVDIECKCYRCGHISKVKINTAPNVLKMDFRFG